VFCAQHDVELEPEARKEIAAAEQGKATQGIFLDQLRAQVHLGRVGGVVEQRWYLHSGANNHMTGS
jgi:hypothetical protein